LLPIKVPCWHIHQYHPSLGEVCVEPIPKDGFGVSVDGGVWPGTAVSVICRVSVFAAATAMVDLGTGVAVEVGDKSFTSSQSTPTSSSTPIAANAQPDKRFRLIFGTFLSGAAV
jgi:hypothetical protein